MKAFLTISILLAMAATAHAATITLPPPTPVIVGASVSTINGAMLFSLLFNHTPDFATVDQFGRPAESFQWYLTDDLKATRPMGGSVADYIMRGDEMGKSGMVRMCTTAPLGAGCPGGWGLDLGPIPSQWNPQTLALSFSVPLDNFTGNLYAYDVISLKYGAQYDGFNGVEDGGAAKRWTPTCPLTQPDCFDVFDSKADPKLPEPSTLLLLPIGLAGLWAVRKRSITYRS